MAEAATRPFHLEAVPNISWLEHHPQPAGTDVPAGSRIAQPDQQQQCYEKQQRPFGKHPQQQQLQLQHDDCHVQPHADGLSLGLGSSTVAAAAHAGDSGDLQPAAAGPDLNNAVKVEMSTPPIAGQRPPSSHSTQTDQAAGQQDLFNPAAMQQNSDHHKDRYLQPAVQQVQQQQANGKPAADAQEVVAGSGELSFTSSSQRGLQEPTAGPAVGEQQQQKDGHEGSLSHPPGAESAAAAGQPWVRRQAAAAEAAARNQGMSATATRRGANTKKAAGASPAARQRAAAAAAAAAAAKDPHDPASVVCPSGPAAVKAVVGPHDSLPAAKPAAKPADSALCQASGTTNTSSTAAADAANAADATDAASGGGASAHGLQASKPFGAGQSKPTAIKSAGKAAAVKQPAAKKAAATQPTAKRTATEPPASSPPTKQMAMKAAAVESGRVQTAAAAQATGAPTTPAQEKRTEPQNAAKLTAAKTATKATVVGKKRRPAAAAAQATKKAKRPASKASQKPAADPASANLIREGNSGPSAQGAMPAAAVASQPAVTVGRSRRAAAAGAAAAVLAAGGSVNDFFRSSSSLPSTRHDSSPAAATAAARLAAADAVANTQEGADGPSDGLNGSSSCKPAAQPHALAEAIKAVHGIPAKPSTAAAVASRGAAPPVSLPIRAAEGAATNAGTGPVAQAPAMAAGPEPAADSAAGTTESAGNSAARPRASTTAAVAYSSARVRKTKHRAVSRSVDQDARCAQSSAAVNMSPAAPPAPATATAAGTESVQQQTGPSTALLVPASRRVGKKAARQVAAAVQAELTAGFTSPSTPCFQAGVAPQPTEETGISRRSRLSSGPNAYDVYICTLPFEYLHVGKAATMQEAQHLKALAHVALYGRELAATRFGVVTDGLADADVAQVAASLAKKPEVLKAMQGFRAMQASGGTNALLSPEPGALQPAGKEGHSTFETSAQHSSLVNFKPARRPVTLELQQLVEEGRRRLLQQQGHSMIAGSAAGCLEAARPPVVWAASTAVAPPAVAAAGKGCRQGDREQPSSYIDTLSCDASAAQHVHCSSYAEFRARELQYWAQRQQQQVQQQQQQHLGLIAAPGCVSVTPGVGTAAPITAASAAKASNAYLGSVTPEASSASRGAVTPEGVMQMPLADLIELALQLVNKRVAVASTAAAGVA